MGSAIRTGFVGFCRGGFFIDLLDDFGAITGANLNGKARACLSNRNCLRNSRGKATKDNCCNCQVVNEKTLANERHTPIIRYIRFSQNAQISSKRLRSRSHVRIVLGRPNASSNSSGCSGSGAILIHCTIMLVGCTKIRSKFAHSLIISYDDYF